MNEAEELAQRACNIEPPHASAYNVLGMIRLRQLEFRQAEIAFRKSLEINPRFDRSLHYLAGSLRSQGKLDEAMQVYRQCIEQFPNFWNSYYDLAILLSMKGEKEEAIEIAKKVVHKSNLAANLWASLYVEKPVEKQTLVDLLECEKIFKDHSSRETLEMCAAKIKELKKLTERNYRVKCVNVAIKRLRFVRLALSENFLNNEEDKSDNNNNNNNNDHNGKKEISNTIEKETLSPKMRSIFYVVFQQLSGEFLTPSQISKLLNFGADRSTFPSFGRNRRFSFISNLLQSSETRKHEEQKRNEKAFLKFVETIFGHSDVILQKNVQ